MNTLNFLESMKVKAQQKANEMKALELSIWDEKHEAGLKELGLSDKKIKEHKQYLLN